MFANETESSYTELSANESRILVLHSSQDGDPIQCHLENFSLDDPPHYEAVSYTWGLDRGENKTLLNNSNTYVLPSEDDLNIGPNSTTPYPFPYDPEYGEYVTQDSRAIRGYQWVRHSSRPNDPFKDGRPYKTLASSKKGKLYRVGNYHWFLQDFALNRRIRSTRSPARNPTLDGSVNDPSMLKGFVALGKSKFVVRKPRAGPPPLPTERSRQKALGRCSLYRPAK